MKPPPELHIRTLNADDAEAFAALSHAVAADNPVPLGLTLEEELSRPVQGFRDNLSYPEPNAVFGAFLNGQLVGSAGVVWPSQFASSRHIALLWGVLVVPNCRRLGIGRAVVCAAVEHAFANGVRRVKLHVYVPNPEAVQLYLSMGFTEYGREPEAVCLDGVYHDDVSMSLARPEA